MTTDPILEPEDRTAQEQPNSIPYKAQGMLEALANRPEFRGRAEDLKELAKAVAADPDHFYGWDRVDLQVAFSPAATINLPESARKHHRILPAVAAAAMFFPLFWTWVSLVFATSAYAELLKEGKAEFQGQSFLQLWVQGFDGKVPFFERLGFVAAVSAGLIFVVAGALLWDRLQRDQAHREQNEAIQKAETDLAAALSCAQREFARKTLTDGTAAESVAQSIRRLEQQQHAVEVATNKFGTAVEKASTQLGETVRNVADVLASIQTSTTSLQDAAKSLADTSREVGDQNQKSLEGWASEMKAATAQHSELLLAATRRHGEQMVAATDNYRAGLDATARSVSDNISLAANQVNAARKSISAALDEFRASRDQATKDLNNVTVQARHENERLIDRTNEAVAKLANVANSAHQDLTQQASEALASVANIANVANEGLTERAANVIADVRDAVKGVGDNLERMQGGLDQLADSVDGFTKAVAGQQLLTRGQIEEMQIAADLLGRVSRTLDDEARDLYLARNSGNGR